MTVTNIDSTKRGLILLYAKNNDTLIRYSVDKNKFIDKSEWVIFNSLGLNKPKFPFLSQLNDVRGFFFNATIVSFGTYALSKAPKTPTAFLKYLKQLDSKLKIENSRQRVKYIIVGILGSFSGFFSGYLFAENIFSPSENSETTQKKINDLKFWEKVELSIWYSYAEDLKNRCIAASFINTTSKQNMDSLMDFIINIEKAKKFILYEIDSEKRSLNSMDFGKLLYYENVIHRLNPSDTKLFEGSVSKSNWLDYLIYSFTFVINCISLTMLSAYFYRRYKSLSKTAGKRNSHISEG
jgi:hypothetical protein